MSFYRPRCLTPSTPLLPIVVDRGISQRLDSLRYVLLQCIAQRRNQPQILDGVRRFARAALVTYQLLSVVVVHLVELTQLVLLVDAVQVPVAAQVSSASAAAPLVLSHDASSEARFG